MSDNVEGVAEQAAEPVAQEAPQVEAVEAAPEQSPSSEATTEAEVSTAESTDSQPKKAGGAKKRIDKLTAEKHAEREAKEAALEKVKALEAKVSELTGNAPKLEDFDHDEQKYQEALIDHKLEIKEAQIEKRMTEQAIPDQKGAALIELRESYQERVTDYLAETGTTPEVFMEKGSYVESALATLDPDTSLALTMGVAELGPEVTEYLYDNPDELEALMQEQSTVSQGIMLGELRSKVLLSKNASKMSKAPEPAPEIGGSTGGVAPQLSMEEAAAKGQSAYSKLRQERLAGQKRKGMGRVNTR